MDDLTIDRYHCGEWINGARSKTLIGRGIAKRRFWHMIARPYHLYVERIVAAKSMTRFYALSISADLVRTSITCVMLGRIGCRGQHQVHVFEHEDEAVELFLQLLSEKRAKGL